MPNLTAAEARSLGVVNQGRRHVSRIAREVTQHQRRHQQAIERLAALEHENPGITRPDLHHTTVYWMLLGCMFAAFVLDAVLFAPAIDELTSTVLGGNPFFLWLARFVIPAAIVSVETTIGTCRHRAMDHTYGQPSGLARLYTLLGVGLALVMPGAIVWTQVASFLGNPDPNQWDRYMLVTKIAFLSILSLVLHLFLVFGGRDAAEAKAYVLGRFMHWRLDSRRGSFEDAAARGLENLDTTFATYDRARLGHNAAYPHLSQEAGPFGPETIQLLRRDSAARPPVGNQHQGPPPQAAPSSPTAPPPPIPPAPPSGGVHSNEFEVTPL